MFPDCGEDLVSFLDKYSEKFGIDFLGTRIGQARRLWRRQRLNCCGRELGNGRCDVHMRLFVLNGDYGGACLFSQGRIGH